MGIIDSFKQLQSWFDNSYSIALLLVMLLSALVVIKKILEWLGLSGMIPGSQQSINLFKNKVYYPCSYWTEKGYRPYQEDRYDMEQGKGGNTGDSSLFACYDGHGGERASQYCLEKLLKTIRDERYFSEDPQIAIREGIRKINDEFSTIARRNSYMDGTTVIMAVIHDKRIVVANVGDSRAIVVGNYKNQLKYRDMSQDHKPERPDEKRRIEKLGGQVIFHGRPRVQGILAVSRAVGDVQLQPYVTAEPEIMDKTIEADDEFLVLASDGLWDVMNNKSVAEFLLERKKKGSSLANIAKELCMEALLRGTQDNVTVLVVDLTEAGRSECLNGKTNSKSSSKSK